MDVYILYLIFTNQKNEDGIFSQKLFPIIAQDSFLNIKTKQGFYTAINRLKKEKLIKKTRIKKIPPENIIKITQKGLDELNIFSELISKEQFQKQNQIKKLTLSLSQSQSQVQSLTQSLEQSKSQKKISKKKYVEKELKDLNKEELEKMVKRVFVKMIDGVNMDEEDFSQEDLKNIKETAREIIEYVREF